VSKLHDKGIGLKNLHESIDTSSSAGKLTFHIFGALAEFERNLIRERTHAGLQAARVRGRMGGRPKKLNPDKAKLAIQLYEGRQHTIKQICVLVGVSKPTLYKYLKK
jgi:DNA invertase Pin-like site-specific DNA recombinase